MTLIDVTAACLEILKDTIVLFSIGFVITGVAVGLLQTIFSVQDPGLPMTAKLVVFMFLLTQEGDDIYEQFHILFKAL